jgi:hypothetical protein
VKLTIRPNYFNGYFGMTVQIPSFIPIIGGINFGGANIDMTVTDTYWQVAAGVYFHFTGYPSSMHTLSVLHCRLA